ncbi:MAG: hypothetical protein AB2A00_11930 [Myxococcota bacterium]
MNLMAALSVVVASQMSVDAQQQLEVAKLKGERERLRTFSDVERRREIDQRLAELRRQRLETLRAPQVDPLAVDLQPEVDELDARILESRRRQQHLLRNGSFEERRQAQEEEERLQAQKLQRVYVQRTDGIPPEMRPEPGVPYITDHDEILTATTPGLPDVKRELDELRARREQLRNWSDNEERQRVDERVASLRNIQQGAEAKALTVSLEVCGNLPTTSKPQDGPQAIPVFSSCRADTTAVVPVAVRAEEIRVRLKKTRWGWDNVDEKRALEAELKALEGQYVE